MILYSEPKVTSEIPKIDLSATFGADAAARQRAAEEIGAACRNTGFFYVIGHGIPASLVERAFAEASRFFALGDAH